MLLSRAAALLLSFCLAAQSGEAAVPALPAESSFSALAHPLTRAQKGLLERNKYKVQSDGSVAAPDGQLVKDADMAFLLRKMGGAQRLKAFVQLDILLTNSDGERHLTPAEREQLRGIVKDNWPYFSLTTRKDFRRYFSVEELERMNEDPPASDSEDAPFMGMKDPEPQPPTEAELLAAAPAPAPKPAMPFFPPVLQPLARPLPAVAPAANALPDGRMAGDGLPISPPLADRQPIIQYVYVPIAALPGGGAVAVAPAANVLAEGRRDGSLPLAAPVLPVTVPPPPAPAAEVETPAPPARIKTPAPTTKIKTPAPTAKIKTPVPAAGGSPPTQPASGPALPAGAPKPPPPPVKVEAPADPTAPVVASVASPNIQPAPGLSALLGKAPAAPPPAPVEKPIVPTVSARPVKPRAIPPADFDKFLLEAPYNRDEKALLKIISDKAPAFARERALAAVMDALPQIVQDSLRAGMERRAALLVYETGKERSYVIALNPSAVLYTRKRMFFGDETIVLPDAPKAFGAMHLGAPPVEAIRREAVAVKEVNDDWGRTKIFSDESRRSSYTQVELAGALLRQLLLLDAHRAGWGASTYTAEVYARVAQMMLYAQIFGELHEDAFLDPDLRSEFRLWLDHPWEYRDYLAHVLSSGRMGLLDPNKGGAESQADFAAQARGACPGSADEDAAARAAAERRADAKAAVALAKTGLADDKQLETAQAEIAAQPALAKPAPERCQQAWVDEAAGARQAAALKSELELAERKFREGRADVAK